MKIDPQRLHLASALDSGSESDSSGEEGEIRSVDLPSPPSLSRDPCHEAFYKVQDELCLRLPEFARSLHWANTLKETGGGRVIQCLVLRGSLPSVQGTSRVHLPRLLPHLTHHRGFLLAGTLILLLF
jgi:hypothetical protein